jgi:ABC-type transport system involved in multi-copper enzyme maturation permease subunit
MIQLVLKELKQLVPFAFLWFALSALYYITELATHRIDEESYSSWCDDYCRVGSNSDVALFTILIILIAAYNLFPREYDDSTIDFLRSLPVKLPKLFWSKIFAAWVMLFGLISLDHMIQAGLLSLNTQSLTGKSYWQVDFALLLRNVLFAVVVISHGVFLSWFRTVGLLIYCAYLIALIWLENQFGFSGIYNVLGFFDNEYSGQQLILNWAVIGFHLCVAFILYFVSYFLWTNTDSKPRAPGTSKASKILPILGVVFSFLLVIGVLAVMVGNTAKDARIRNIQAENTEHYSFTYNAEDTQAMNLLIPFVEQDYAALAELLGVTELPRIQADMTSESDHALGLASWKKIRMVLNTPLDVDPLYRRVLSHETAHVLQSTESNRKLGEFANSTGFFIEGMAQYVSFSIVSDDVSRDSNWLVSSLAWQRQNIKFAEMANRTIFDTLYDGELLYGIGDIWVHAMADACGVESLGNFLRAIGRDNAPPNLSGVAFWRSHLQYIDCELALVNNRWRQIMQDLIDNRTQGSFPEFENVAISQASDSAAIKIRADIIPDESGQLQEIYYIKIKSETQLASVVSPILSGRLKRDGANASVEFFIEPHLISGRQFRYQLGFIPMLDSRHYFNKWRTGSIP